MFEEIIAPILLFIVGLLLIIFGGDKFVDASVSIAKRLGVSEIIIGATIVSLGTTLPEVLVSTTAAFSGSADIAAGNAFGSIICNSTLIAGLNQLLKPVDHISRKEYGWRLVFFYLAGATCFIFGIISGFLGLICGIILLLMAAIYAYLNIRLSRQPKLATPDIPAEKTDEADETKSGSLGKDFLVLIITAAMLFVGARLLVDNGIIIAELVGVPERVIAVTFIALGTSLPELVTAITSVVKGHGAVSIGNILGANILNFLFVIGIPALIGGITPSASAITIDLPVALLAMSILALPLLIRKKGSRIHGAILIAAYAAYCAYSFIGS